MITNFKSNSLFYCLTFAIVALAWQLQSYYPLNWDVSWDLLVTQRLLAGGTYTHDYVDLNPPLIFYVYAPVIFLQKYLSISLFTALCFYVFFLSILSFILCYRFIKTFFSNNYPRMVFSAALLLVLLIVPVHYFGEREHLVLLFTLPYLFASIYQLQGGTLSRFEAFGLSFFSFFGWAIKPHFLIALILIECYRMFYTRRLFSWLRVDTITLCILFVSYGCFIFYVHADFINTVMPLALHFYYAGFRDPLKDVLTQPAACFCYFVLIFFAVQHRSRTVFTTSLCLAIIGFFSAYVLQQTDWFYHLYPAYGLALLLMVSLFLLATPTLSKKLLLGLIIAGGLLAFPIIYFRSLHVYAITYKTNRQPLATFLKQYAANQPVYFISANPNEIFPTVQNAQAIYASRFMHLFWMPGVAKTLAYQPQQAASVSYKRDEARLFDMMIEDINTYKPKYIFIDVKDHKPFYSYVPFQYLPYFLKQAAFRQAFKPYRRITKITARNMTENLSHWQLYWVPDAATIKLNNINNLSVVLTGQGPIKIAYFVKKNQILKTTMPVTITVSLSATELALFKNPGVVQRTTDNAELINTILNKAVAFPAYQFDVYERCKT